MFSKNLMLLMLAVLSATPSAFALQPKQTQFELSCSANGETQTGSRLLLSIDEIFGVSSSLEPFTSVVLSESPIMIANGAINESEAGPPFYVTLQIASVRKSFPVTYEELRGGKPSVFSFSEDGKAMDCVLRKK